MNKRQKNKQFKKWLIKNGYSDDGHVRCVECLYYNEYTLITDDVEGWLLHPENKVKLLNAIDNGYEVEKEQLYYVKLPGVGYLNNADGGIKHTEQEIKAIDERYWPFAVKVEEE
ncbi:DUF1642 domain-containing protein [Enterococcus faecalis]|uniref:DUF1642 domain-containing protein n=1 Tax=Enterococcus faecalis TaxID=1351 RepID=UPI001144E48E|nr:DUF1642 domain-containing protein [Enterococcus faecalis]NMP56435.1 DUF1642 domain-containing protein [Enterococcus faecalis]TQB23813.1 DUF1642 domain-containing protein [Enterococcus faecalis]WCG39213.1 DUF1642 domain-containing protein [Enterococcus faecalis]